MRIITLSTIPPRFATLAPTLNSLLQQKGQIDEVRLYIPKKYRRFPEYDGFLPSVPAGIKIFRPDDDMGPASKVLFAAKEFRNQSAQILFCDDDKIFSSVRRPLFSTIFAARRMRRANRERYPSKRRKAFATATKGGPSRQDRYRSPSQTLKAQIQFDCLA
ncbi:hypothetical protein [Rhizobium sp. BR 362]|uniref:hypothetical protein n=1 Tax=Rhizobium sp. BR 362 TaxID=3040670 RepID=UPI002F40D70C